MKNAGIILAGGTGSRFDSTLSSKKQFIEFDGEPLFFKSLRCFDESRKFEKIIISLPKDDFQHYKNQIINLSLNSNIDFVMGGSSRQKSVMNAFDRIKNFFDIVIIQDGVRPFIKKTWINKLIKLMNTFDGAIIAIPSSDTIKISKDKKKITKTLDRDEIWFAQTPQSFKVSILKKAFDYSLNNNFEATDESGLVEKIGGKVGLVLGDKYNIKLTNKEDLLIAKSILKNL
tara:strand:- start:11707 stop:12396 length:690 start_codon:yes stop_codon:yes gene_type:complete